MTHRDVPRSLAEKHHQHDLAAVARQALVAAAQREEPIVTKTEPVVRYQETRRYDERRDPLEELLELEAATAGELSRGRRIYAFLRRDERAAA
jgi:hypothetical protein